jgi:Flp pilus assembly protein TadB
MALVYMLAAGLVVTAVGGWDERRRVRAEARAELARARASAVRRHPSAAAYRQAHERLHAAHHALLPHIPRPRTGGDW